MSSGRGSSRASVPLAPGRQPLAISAFLNMSGLLLSINPRRALRPFSVHSPLQSQHVLSLQDPTAHDSGQTLQPVFPSCRQPHAGEEWTLLRTIEGRQIKWARLSTLRMLRKGQSSHLVWESLGNSKWQNNSYSNLILAQTISVREALNEASEDNPGATGRLEIGSWLSHRTTNPFSRKWG